MTDYSELKRLAERIREGSGLQGMNAEEAMFNFECAATPAAILALIAENEALRKGIDPSWSLMDQSILIDHLRLNTNFTADKFDAMIQFAVECAQYVELHPAQGEQPGG